MVMRGEVGKAKVKHGMVKQWHCIATLRTQGKAKENNMAKILKHDGKKYKFDRLGKYVWAEEEVSKGNYKPLPVKTIREMMDYIYGKNK